MARLIDADALLEKTQFRLPTDNPIAEIYAECVAIHRENIEEAPTVDAVPVVHGWWIEMERGHYFKCSRCRNPIPYKFGWKVHNGVLNKRYYNYCPNCGARMDGDE